VRKTAREAIWKAPFSPIIVTLMTADFHIINREGDKPLMNYLCQGLGQNDTNRQCVNYYVDRSRNTTKA